jgi:ABC-2 type transport system permease protein
MRLLRSEVQRLLARRLFRVVAVLLLGLAVLIVGRTAFTSEKATPERVAAAVAEQRAEADRFRADCLASVAPADQAQCEGIEGPPLDYLLNTFRFVDSAPGLVEGLGVALGLIGFVVGAGFLGAEWAAGTLGHLLVWEPRRVRVLAGKATALALGVAGVGTAVMALYLAALYGAAALRGSLDGTDAGVVTSVALVGVRGVVLGVATALAGFALAGLLRSTTGALGVGFAYFVAGELALRNISRGAEPWLLSTNVGAWLERRLTLYIFCGDCSDGQRQVVITDARAATYLGILILAALALTATLFHRRDVT